MFLLGTFYFIGDPLDCTTYRAWAPGSPRKARKKFDCVVLTKHRTWVSMPCKNNLPIVCELIPGGPYKKGSLFASRMKKPNGSYSQISNKVDIWLELTTLS